MNVNLYRAVWRWHFYAGLLVLPVLCWLAVTGGLYLYKPEIERWLYADWLRVETHGAPLPLDALAKAVSASTGQPVTQIARPAAADESWRLTLGRGDGRRTAFVDPGSGRVLGTTSYGGVMQTVRDLHSLIIGGPFANAIVEIAAGWTIILVVTGVCLWLPRGMTPAVGLRGSPKGRLFWRDLHASTGIVVGAVLLFLAVTGLPWSGVWGEALQSVVASNGLGRPRPSGDQARSHHAAHEGMAAMPWSMQDKPRPESAGPGDVGPDAVAKAAGLRAPWTMNFPSRPGAPYLVSAAVTRADDAHVVYVDAATGRRLLDARYRDFGAGARAVEWGIAVHQGQQYGEVNRLVMLLGCVSAVLLSLTAPVMWWKRRAGGRLSAPPGGAGGRGLLVLMLAGGLLLPLTGLTMLAALALEALLGRHRTAPEA